MHWSNVQARDLNQVDFSLTELTGVTEERRSGEISYWPNSFGIQVVWDNKSLKLVTIIRRLIRLSSFACNKMTLGGCIKSIAYRIKLHCLPFVVSHPLSLLCVNVGIHRCMPISKDASLLWWLANHYCRHLLKHMFLQYLQSKPVAWT